MQSRAGSPSPLRPRGLGLEPRTPDLQVPGGGDDSSFKCRTCRSRSGWGAYATAGLNIAVERSHRFWVGVESRLFHGRTNGDPLGGVPPLETRDTWINTAGFWLYRRRRWMFTSKIPVTR